MSAPLLKDLLDLQLLQRLASSVKQQHTAFDSSRFISTLWDALYAEQSLKQRVRRIASTLYHQLNLPFAEVCTLLQPVSKEITGLPGFIFPDIVEQFGLDDFDTSMQALAHFTCYSTAEFAIRPFFRRYPEQSLQQLQIWSQSANVHHRRLASEGCRPRLPWGQALPQFIADPAPLLPVLRALKQDPEDYVRRSVANNLNDISKDHPSLVLQLAQQWYGSHIHTDWILKHALRGLLKQRNSEALALFDCAPRQLTNATLSLAQSSVKLWRDAAISCSVDAGRRPVATPCRICH
ncbi:MAG: DNA alkylation repair protein [Rheinheimera sp.]|nr:DNA alkylation repair protein [Rheinheimera sp.]